LVSDELRSQGRIGDLLLRRIHFGPARILTRNPEKPVRQQIQTRSLLGALKRMHVMAAALSRIVAPVHEADSLLERRTALSDEAGFRNTHALQRAANGRESSFADAD